MSELTPAQLARQGNRTRDGRYAEGTASNPGMGEAGAEVLDDAGDCGLTPQLDQYWSSVADRHNLDVEERDALARHLAERDDSEDTVDTTCSEILAQSLRPAMLVSLERSQRIDEALADEIGEDIGHGLTSHGMPLVTCYSSTSTYMLSCVSSGSRLGFRINTESYQNATEIPARYRKARAVAEQFQAFHEAGAMTKAIGAWEAAENRRRRWGYFGTLR